MLLTAMDVHTLNIDVCMTILIACFTYNSVSTRATSHKIRAKE